MIDPTKVVRTGRRHAASAGSPMITTAAMIAERPEQRSGNDGPTGGGMGGLVGMCDMGF